MFHDMIAFFADPANWSGTTGIPNRVLEHLGYSVLAVLIAIAIAMPIGLLIGHTGKGSVITVGIANILRALPSLGLMILLVLLMGIGLLPPTIAFVALAIPPILAGTYSGIQNVDRVTVDAARAMGMRESQIIFSVEIPIALPLIIAGIRNAMLQVIATATIAAVVSLGGIGQYLIIGVSLRDYGRVMAGAVLVTLLAIVVDAILAGVGKLVEPGQSVFRRRLSATVPAMQDAVKP